MTYAFLVGYPRSGTTWLQMLLAQHPAIATAQETHLFSGYVACLEEVWGRHATTPRGIGLQAALTREQFDALCTDFARGVLAAIGSRVEGASVVLEKTPAHVRVVPLIARLLPQARFIHLVRDPRAAVASMCAAGRSWGHRWASTDLATNARLWVSDVSAGNAIGSFTEHHYTLKYEDLLGDDGWRVLQALFKWLDLEEDDTFCREAIANCAIDRLRRHGEGMKAGKIIRSDPTGFYRKGNSDSWRSELSPANVRIVEYIAADLMREYGYTPSTRAAELARKPARLKYRQLLDSLEWRARRAVAKSFEKARRFT